MSLTDSFPRGEKKYELVPDRQIIVAGTTLYRIQALKDFGNVKAGSLGGFVASERNLSQRGDCWVADEAQVYDEAVVSDDAQIYGRGRVYGHGRVGDRGQVLGNGQVFENGWVFKSGLVFDNAMVFGSAQVRDKGMVYADAQIFENVRVVDDGQVFGHARLSGKTVVGGREKVGDVVSHAPQRRPTRRRDGPRAPSPGGRRR
jgi:carbonic anhydrase/acetyltransferase-like protein (isoleucine patch superfamily)